MSLLRLTAEEAARIGKETLVFGHNLADHPLLSESAMADLLDAYPYERLIVLTMGDDPTRSQDNERLEHRGLRGTEMIAALKTGRIWYNLTGVDEVDPRYRQLVTDIYDELAEHLPEYRGIETHANILVSAPEAMVYYHVDGPPSFLWHISGRKRVWSYPALDTDLLPTDLLEEVFAGVRQEYIPYRSEFDAHAKVFDLDPGQVASWPQNAPHRISNLDSVNISLSTDHFTPAARRRARVYNANRFLHGVTKMPRGMLSTREGGPVCAAKVLAYRVGRRFRPDDLTRKAHRAPTRAVDPKAPGSIRAL